MSHDEDPITLEVGASVNPLGVGFLLGRDVGQTVPDPRHRAANRAHRPRDQAVQRLRWQRFNIQCTTGGAFIDGGDDVADRSPCPGPSGPSGPCVSTVIIPQAIGARPAVIDPGILADGPPNG